MTPARFMLIVLLLIGGLVTFFIVRKVFASEEVTETRERVRQVPVAFSDLEPGTLITEEHLARAPKRASALGEDSVVSQGGLIGRYVRKTIPKNTVISVDQVYGPGQYPELAPRTGMQPYAVPVGDSTNIVNGFVKPGDYVDVVMIPESVPDERFNDAISQRIMDGVKILAVNGSLAGADTDRGGNSLTLELGPRQVNMMNLARARGSLTFSLNPAAKKRAEENGDMINAGTGVGDPDRVTFRELLNLPPEPEEEEEEEEKPYTTAVYRRAGYGLNTFDKETGDPLGVSVNNFFRNRNRFGIEDLTTDATGQQPRGYYGANGAFIPAPGMMNNGMMNPVPAVPTPVPAPAPANPFTPPGIPGPVMGPSFN